MGRRRISWVHVAGDAVIDGTDGDVDEMQSVVTINLLPLEIGRGSPTAWFLSSFRGVK